MGNEQDSVINQIIMNQLFPAAKDAFQLFRDLTNLVMRKPTQWIRNFSVESPGEMQSFAIELIEHIVRNFPSVFKGVFLVDFDQFIFIRSKTPKHPTRPSIGPTYP